MANKYLDKLRRKAAPAPAPRAAPVRTAAPAPVADAAPSPDAPASPAKLADVIGNAGAKAPAKPKK